MDRQLRKILFNVCNQRDQSVEQGQTEVRCNGKLQSVTRLPALSQFSNLGLMYLRRSWIFMRKDLVIPQQGEKQLSKCAGKLMIIYPEAVCRIKKNIQKFQRVLEIGSKFIFKPSNHAIMTSLFEQEVGWYNGIQTVFTS